MQPIAYIGTKKGPSVSLGPCHLTIDAAFTAQVTQLLPGIPQVFPHVL